MRLDPLPTTATGASRPAAQASASVTPANEVQMASASAVPPTRILVNGASGTCSRMPAVVSATEGLENARAKRGDVASTHGDDQIAGAQIGHDHGWHVGEQRHEHHLVGPRDR